MSGALAGITVMVTRPADQASPLAAALQAEGAKVLEVPSIAIEPPLSWEEVDQAITGGNYDWVVFSSVNGVQFFLDRLARTQPPADWFAGARIAAVGPTTARRIRDAGLTVNLLPDEFDAEALVACLLDSGSLLGRRVLIPLGNIARPTLQERLRHAGALVDAPIVYRTVSASPPDGLLARMRSGEIDAVTFASSSAVRGLLEMAGIETSDLARLTVACIGPVTAATAREVGLEPDVIARTATTGDLVRALCAHYAISERARANS